MAGVKRGCILYGNRQGRLTARRTSYRPTTLGTTGKADSSEMTHLHDGMLPKTENRGVTLAMGSTAGNRSRPEE